MQNIYSCEQLKMNRFTDDSTQIKYCCCFVVSCCYWLNCIVLCVQSGIFWIQKTLLISETACILCLSWEHRCCSFTANVAPPFCLFLLSLAFCSRIVVLPFFLKSFQKTLCAIAMMSFLCHSLSCVIPFSFSPMRFLALVAQQHQVIFGGTEQVVGKKQHIRCKGVLCHSAELVGLKSTQMFEWTCAKAVI